MRYFNVMCLSLNEGASSLKLMEDSQEEIMKEKQQHKRFYAFGCGGRHSIRIQRLIVRHVMHVRGRAGHQRDELPQNPQLSL